MRFHLFRATVLPFLTTHRGLPSVPPVIIGAMGGSGTRVLPRILRLCGFWMGAWVNPVTQDAMASRYFLQRHFSHLVNHEAGEGQLMEELSRLMVAHRWGMPNPDARWGWKNPRNMWIIPFLSRIHPEMKFIHVVRDGRDMALSDNTNLLCKYGAFLLDDPDCERDRVATQLKLWTLGNQIARSNGRTYLGSNYFLLNYERLCRRPRETLVRLFDFLGLEASGQLVESAGQLVSPSRNIGRWKASDLKLLHEPDEETRELLYDFGYDSTGRSREPASGTEPLHGNLSWS